jgi:hypothetical protein
MVPLARLVFTVITVVSVLAGCGGEPVPPEPGPAARQVNVVRGDQDLRVTAEVTGWEVKPHPQVPDRGDTVFFTYRFTPEEQGRVDLQICAVDDHRVVLLCGTITNNGFVDGWIGPDPPSELGRTADVVLLPNQMYPGENPHDPKDHDGYVPPRYVQHGDKL